jgi:flagellar motility protein MotE (MotC chaperone)
MKETAGYPPVPFGERAFLCVWRDANQGEPDEMSDQEQTNEQQTDQTDDKQTEQKQDDTSGLRSALQAERDARKTADKELKTLQKRLADLEDRDKSELEKVSGERDRLIKDLEAREARLRILTASEKVHSAATKANAIEPAAVFKLVRDDLTFDDDGAPTNVSEVVAEAKKQYPAMFQASSGSGDGGRGNNGKTNVDGAATINQLIRQASGVIS